MAIDTTDKTIFPNLGDSPFREEGVKTAMAELMAAGVPRGAIHGEWCEVGILSSGSKEWVRHYDVQAKLLAPFDAAYRRTHAAAYEFRRKWYYWVVHGPVPKAAAEEIYATTIGQASVRADGHCGARFTYYDLAVDALPYYNSRMYWGVGEDGSVKAITTGLCAELFEWNREHTFHFVNDGDDIEKVAQPYIDIHHIGSQAGLDMYVKTLRKYQLIDTEER